MKKRVFLYVRVSTQEQARDGYSVDEQIERLMDLYAIGQFPIDALQSKVNSITEQKEKLEDELDRLMDEEKQRLTHEQTKELIESFSGVLENGDFDEIRTVIGALIDKIEIDDENVTIRWNFA